MTNSTLPLRPRAVLVGVQLPGVSEIDHAAELTELGRLAHTLGFEVVATVSQRRDSLASGAVLGEGKLKELAALTGGAGEVPTGAQSVNRRRAPVSPVRVRRRRRRRDGRERRR